MFAAKRPFVGDVAEHSEPAPLDPALYTVIPPRHEAAHRADETVAAAVILQPGADVVSSLEDLPPDRLSDGGLIDAIVGCARQIAALEAKQQEFLAEIARRDPDDDLFLRAEVGPALRLAPGTAAQRIDIASELMGRLWDTRELMYHGRLSYTHGRILATATENLSDEIAAKVQKHVLRRACTQTPGEFRASIRRAVAYYDRKDEEQRHQEAVQRRRVVREADADGMSWIHVFLPDDGAAVFLASVNVWAAKSGPGDERTADQRRADAAVEIASAGLAMPGLPTSHGLKASINVTLAASTLAGQDDQPGYIYGEPVPAQIARRLATQATEQRHYWAVDAAGRVLDQPCTHLSSDAYTPPPRLARHVIFRDTFCVWPGCRRNAHGCELDHRTPWPDGPTNAENLQPLCKPHHDLKHHSTWRVERTDDNTYDWISPTRHRYRYRPPDHPVPIPAPPPTDDTPPPF